jgi:putative thioredoxin
MIDFNAAVLERSRAIPVVVDFWADWCGPCYILEPIVQGLAAEADGRWELVKIDVGAQPELANELGLRSIPAVKMFHGGAVVAEFVGARPAEWVRRWLDANLPEPHLVRP